TLPGQMRRFPPPREWEATRRKRGPYFTLWAGRVSRWASREAHPPPREERRADREEERGEREERERLVAHGACAFAQREDRAQRAHRVRGREEVVRADGVTRDRGEVHRRD